ncbi:hypothetical protein [Brenneria uluponensis]|uniref:hypothetical protein n=1 Tax=Brenneria uluponensis TaxID=3057057 RepID=UPI0028EC142C|nr:hypothetical protein [Brenneria ulupoensis]
MRNVYEVNGYTDFIIKEDTTAGNKANETEATVYFTAVIKNFQSVLECIAEIRSISQSGKYLIMEKLEANIPSNLRPDGKMPDEVSDNKLENFGITLGNNKIKCLDYALLKNDHKPGKISGNVRSANLPTDQIIDEMKQRIESIIQIINDS